jgi:hypothetical protein
MFHRIANKHCSDLLLLEIPLTILGLIFIDYNSSYIFTNENPMVSIALLFSIQIVIFAIGLCILAL